MVRYTGHSQEMVGYTGHSQGMVGTLEACTGNGGVHWGNSKGIVGSMGDSLGRVGNPGAFQTDRWAEREAVTVIERKRGECSEEK